MKLNTICGAIAVTLGSLLCMLTGAISVIGMATLLNWAIISNKETSTVKENDTQILVEEVPEEVPEKVTDDIVYIALPDNADATNAYNTRTVVSTEQYSADEVYGVLEYYNMIPQNIRAAFEASDWRWTLVDGDLGAKFGFSYGIMGLTSWGDHEIFIQNDENSWNSIIHEIGHWMSREYRGGIDQNCINTAFNREWRALYIEFGGAENNYNTPDEFIASVFEYYVQEPDRLKNVAPYSYDLMNLYVRGV